MTRREREATCEFGSLPALETAHAIPAARRVRRLPPRRPGSAVKDDLHLERSHRHGVARATRGLPGGGIASEGRATRAGRAVGRDAAALTLAYVPAWRACASPTVVAVGTIAAQPGRHRSPAQLPRHDQQPQPSARASRARASRRHRSGDARAYSFADRARRRVVRRAPSLAPPLRAPRAPASSTLGPPHGATPAVAEIAVASRRALRGGRRANRKDRQPLWTPSSRGPGRARRPAPEVRDPAGTGLWEERSRSDHLQPFNPRPVRGRDVCPSSRTRRLAEHSSPFLPAVPAAAR